MLPFAEHNCGDSMLKCIDCDTQICPKCLVECPVGNRCANCTKRFTSHLLQISPWIIVRALLGGIIAGFLFLLSQIFCPLSGFFMLLIYYFLGALAGNLIFKIAGRKIGKKMAIAVGIGVLTGNFFHISLSLILFLLGTTSPFLGWSFSWPGFRR